jgi:NAD(P)-dependent dehydrogenase (short-subunit alcohol dehydrogenase family)
VRRDVDTAVVTGGCGGIGTAVCLRLAEEGMRIAVLDLAPADRLQSLLAGKGAELWYRRVDLADPQQIAAAFAALDGDRGPPRVLVNVAGASMPAGSSSRPRRQHGG